MATTGRPSKFTPETCAIILEQIEAGNFLSTAAQYAGISYKVFKEWMKRGKSDAVENAEFRAFRAAVRRARAKAEADSVANIRRANTWTADAWFLERSFRERWAPSSKSKVEMNAKVAVAEVDPKAQQAMLANQKASELACLIDELLTAPGNDPGTICPKGESRSLGMPAAPSSP